MYKSLGPVQALSTSLPAINTLISSCIIGNSIGQNALAAIGFVGPFSYIVLAFANIMGVGSQLVCSKHIGEGDKEGINQTFNTTMFLCFTCGLILSLLVFLFPYSVAKMLGAQGEILQMTADYIKGYAACCLFSILLNSVIPFLQLDCAKTLTTVCILIQIVFNIVLNVLNAYVFHFGMLGVGLASSISSLISLIVGALYFAFRSKLFKFSISFITNTESKSILSYGVNYSVMFLWFFFRDRIFNYYAFAIGGSVLISAFTVANNISNAVGCSLQAALSGPTNIISSVFIGERDVESLRETPRVAISTFYPFNIIAYLLIFFLARPIVMLFGAGSSDLEIYIFALRVFNLWILTNPAKSVPVSIYSALKKIREGSIFNALGCFVYPVLCILLAKLTNSLFLIFSFAWVPEALLIVTFFVYSAMKTKSRNISLSRYVYIPRDFTVSKDDALAITIKEVDQATEASDRIVSFCKKKGMSEKDSYYCGLCVEEISVDKVNNCFEKKSDTLDIRLIYENDEMTIMFRDTCKQFNPSEWLKLHAEDNPIRSIGLKMVTKLAKEMNYSGNLGLNVLTIKI